MVSNLHRLVLIIHHSVKEGVASLISIFLRVLHEKKEPINISNYISHLQETIGHFRKVTCWMLLNPGE
jgi:hypothetical protein